jgi:hypothetical protein
MLKRLSEAISQSKIKSDSPASEIYCPNHSSCNYSPKQNVDQTLKDARAWNPATLWGFRAVVRNATLVITIV